ncbi:MAG: peptide ABC transporter substrate-binding protein, partial [Rhodospirillales bacterium]|nr:peptide ABC transporter substrate-binding protein [Rhodospirillales bacterium]
MSRFRRLVVTLILLAALAAASPARAAKDELVIGITQFPSTFHPAMDSMMAKSYIQAMARRPVTVHDKDWKVVCLLCTELPTIENGLAVPEDLPDGRKGIRVTYSLQPQARWGDGTPLTTADVVFSWQVGKHPRSGLSNVELYRRITAIDVKDDKTFTLHVDKLTFDYNAINDLEILPAHLERKVFEAEPAAYRNRTLFDAEPTNPGLYFGPYRITQVSRGAFVVLEPNPTWYGPKPAFKRIVVKTIENSAAL